MEVCHPLRLRLNAQGDNGLFKMTLDACVGTFSGKIKFDGVLLLKTWVCKGQGRFSDDTGEVEFGAE